VEAIKLLVSSNPLVQMEQFDALARLIALACIA
jgi:hypothetical protein